MQQTLSILTAWADTCSLRAHSVSFFLILRYRQKNCNQHLQHFWAPFPRTPVWSNQLKPTAWTIRSSDVVADATMPSSKRSLFWLPDWTRGSFHGYITPKNGFWGKLTRSKNPKLWGSGNQQRNHAAELSGGDTDTDEWICHRVTVLRRMRWWGENWEQRVAWPPDLLLRSDVAFCGRGVFVPSSWHFMLPTFFQDQIEGLFDAKQWIGGCFGCGVLWICGKRQTNTAIGVHGHQHNSKYVGVCRSASGVRGFWKTNISLQIKMRENLQGSETHGFSHSNTF